MPKKKSKKKPRIAITIADENNLEYAKKMENSLRKFHSEKELPLFIVGPEELSNKPDPHFFYRATPLMGRGLIDQFETVIKLDADQVITGDISHVWEGDFDVGVVNNSNPREFKEYPVTVWNIHPLSYVNCGFVVMKSERFINHWVNLCLSPHFNFYKMREQDLLNILVFYGDYKVKFLDNSPMWHGLVSKGYWPKIKLVKDKLILPKNKEWPNSEDKQIVCLHWAGGDAPDKLNFNKSFKPKVAKHLKKLVK